MTTKTVVLTTTGPGTFPVPADYGTPSRLILIGGGSRGGDGGLGAFSGYGGGAGECWWKDNPTLTPGAGYSCQVGVTNGTRGSSSSPGSADTWFISASSFAYAQGAQGNSSAPGNSITPVGGGNLNPGGVGGAGGFAGANGGGGGGAAGPNGAGAAGGNGGLPANGSANSGGPGGGGANGGTAGGGPQSGGNPTGANGGDNRLGAGGGTGGTGTIPGTNGTAGGGGGGGGGGSSGSSVGGDGSQDDLWNDGVTNYGPGGGAGGGGNENASAWQGSNGGAAGGYGAGGGGGAYGNVATLGGAGTSGIIVLVYTPAVLPTSSVWTAAGAGSLAAAAIGRVVSHLTAAGAGVLSASTHSPLTAIWTSAGVGALVAAQVPDPFVLLPTTLQHNIASYLYWEYRDDDDLQAFVIAYNDLAQGFLNWFSSVSLPVYTSEAVSGELLDWVGAGLYGQPRPSLPVGYRFNLVGPYNTWALNSWVTNRIRKVATSADSGESSAIGSFVIGVSPIGGGITYLANDDIYRRVMSWRFFKGDGKHFNVRWLKRRIMRFLYGVDGIYFNADQTYQISVSFGLDGQVNIRLVRYVRSVSGGALYNRFALNKVYCNELVSTVVIFPSIPTGLLLQAGIESGVLELPFQFQWVVNV